MNFDLLNKEWYMYHQSATINLRTRPELSASLFFDLLAQGSHTYTHHYVNLVIINLHDTLKLTQQ